MGRAEVDVVADTRGFEAEVRAAADRAGANGIDVKVTPDLTGFRDRINAATRGYRVSIRVVPDVTGFRDELRAKLAGLRPVDVRVNPNVNNFRQLLNRQLRGGAPVNIPLRPHLTTPTAIRDWGQTGAFGNVIIAGLFGEIGHLWHSLSFLDPALQKLNREFRNTWTAARRVIPAIASLGGAFAAFGRSLVAAFARLGVTGSLFGTLARGLRTALTAVRGGLSSMLGAFTGFASRAATAFTGAFRGLSGALRAELNTARGLLNTFGRSLRAFGGSIAAALRTAFGGGAGLGRGFGLIGLQLYTGLRLAFDRVRGLTGQITNHFRVWGRQLGGTLGGAFRGITSALGTAAGALGRFGSTVGSALSTAFGALSRVGSAIGGAVGTVVQGLQGLFGALRSVGSSVLGAVRQLHALTAALFGVAQAVLSAMTPFIQFTGALVAGVAGMGALYAPIGGLIQLVDGLGAGFATLPAALSIGVAGLTTVIFALGGVSRAIGAALQQDDALFKRSLVGLSQLQTKFAQTLHDIFRPVQEQASAAFINPVLKAIDALKGTGAGSAFSSGIKSASDAMGALAANALKFLGTAPGIRLIQQSFGGLRSIFQGLANGMPVLLKGISDATNALLGGTGIKTLEQSVQSLTERFGRFLSGAAINGSIHSSWLRFKATLKDVWSLAGSLIGIMHGLSNAMIAASSGQGRGQGGGAGAAGGPLGSIAAAFKDMDKWVNGPAQSKLISFFRQLDDVGRAVWSTFKELAKAFAEFATGMLSIGQSGGGAGGGKGGGGGALSSFADAIRKIGETFAAHKEDIRDFGKSIGLIFDELTKNNRIGSFLENLGLALVVTIAAIQKTVDAFKTFGNVLKELYEGDIGKTKISLQDIVNFLADLVNGIITLFGKIKDFWVAIGDGLDQVVGFFQKAYDTLLGNSIIPDIVNGIQDWFNRLPQIIVSAIEGIPGAIAGVFGQIWGAVSGQLASFGSQVLGYMAALPGQIGSAIASIPSIVAGVFSGLWGAVSGQLQAFASQVLGFFSGLGDQIRGAISSALSSASDLLHSGGNWNPLNWFANGAVINSPQVVGVGEAGPEVIIPLTRPDRAAELAARSGLLDLLARTGTYGNPAGSAAHTTTRDISVHLHTPASSPEVLVRSMQRALAAALA